MLSFTFWKEWWLPSQYYFYQLFLLQSVPLLLNISSHSWSTTLSSRSISCGVGGRIGLMYLHYVVNKRVKGTTARWPCNLFLSKRYSLLSHRFLYPTIPFSMVTFFGKVGSLPKEEERLIFFLSIIKFIPKAGAFAAYCTCAVAHSRFFFVSLWPQPA